MSNSISLFRSNITSIRIATSTIENIDALTTSILNVDDLYRVQIVMAISALDHFIHEFVLEEMLEIFRGTRAITPAFNKFQIPICLTMNSILSDTVIVSQIRQKHSWLSFQDPDKISDAIRLVSEKKVWEEISPRLMLSAAEIKTKLKLIVDRRNKIAHESDLDPSYPGTKWPITIDEINQTVNFIEDLVEAIFDIIN